MLARRLPINTKTKLDLTKLFYSRNFTIPFYSLQNYIEKSSFSTPA